MIDLCQLDIDAVAAYEIALKRIDDPKIHLSINNFRIDHITHIKELSNLIKRYGGKPPKQTPDIQGYVMTGMTALKSHKGIEGALQAMQDNEITTNRHYRETLYNYRNLPIDVKTVLKRNLWDGHKHLNYIKEVIPEVERFKAMA